MVIRQPPDTRAKPPGRRSAQGFVKYQEPSPGILRRILKVFLKPPVLVTFILLSIASIAVLGYYYTVYSSQIDRRLAGEIFTRAAGIYAAPRQIRAGQSIGAEALVNTLKRAGYVEKLQQAEGSRGRFLLRGTQLDVEPSKDANMDGRNQYFPFRIQFDRGGKVAQSIINTETGKKVSKAYLEPELISSVTGPSRGKRKVIGFKDLPDHLVKAIIVTEDRTFFEHHGINVRGIIRAFVRRYEADTSSPLSNQGGSSITQQLVKNIMLSPERTLKRKLAEAYMSVILETRLTKEEIFALYANEVYLGQLAGFGIHGFGEAADAYFNKDVTALNLPESAFLAGLIRSPNRYNPYKYNEKATARRNQVLDSMVEAGAITSSEASVARSTELKVAPVKGRIDISDAPYFIDHVQNQLAEIVSDPAAAQHLRIYTTIDMDLQRAAYAAVSKQLNALDKLFVKRKVPPGSLQAALVAMNVNTGEIIAMVGGRDYEKSQLNRATDAMRQPGSVFKPFVYATALNSAYDPSTRVITPATVFTDEPKTFTYDGKEYSPGNFGDSYSMGPVTLRDALVKSLNVITVEVAMEVNTSRVMNLASKAGLPKPARTYPSMALGSSEATPLQVASAYTAFAGKGVRVTPISINRITTSRGDTVAAPTTNKHTVMSDEVAFVMTSFMKDVVNRGTAARIRARGFKANVAGKTGTSRDGWFAGYTPNIACAVYVGFDDGSELGLTGSESALPIWADFMTAALSSHPEWGGDWQKPNGVEEALIDPSTGLLASEESENRRLEYFIGGTVPKTEGDSAEMPDTGEADTTPDGSGLPDLPPGMTPGEQPTPSPKTDSEDAPPDVPKLLGTITLDICPTTGLIADPSCPVIRSRSFTIGQQPKKNCRPEYHSGKLIIPSATRPRTAQ
jgi:penicillin-binding protein 1B